MIEASKRWRARTKSLVSRITVIAIIATALVPLGSQTASAAPNLTVSLITWGVIGLDSNNVNTGPNSFASGARVCNTGSSAATNVTATYVWDTANAYISLFGTNPLTTPAIAAGGCFDFYFNITITRNAAAYDTARGFHINVTADSLGTISTPTPREVYVQKLVSQNRNQIDGFSGPTSVAVGGTYTYVLNSHTTTGGYDQLSSFINFPNTVFQVMSVTQTYTVPVGATNDTIYGDACGWDPVPTSATYNSCIGPNHYAGGKVGDTVVTTYSVKILDVTSSNVDAHALIYDHSGGSYHYNSDYDSGPHLSIAAVERADVKIQKSDSPDPVKAGNNVTYTLTVQNLNYSVPAAPLDSQSTAHNVTVTDPLPAGTSFVSADHGGSLSGGTVTWNLGDMATGASQTLTLVLQVDPSRTSNISNTASVSTTSTDPVNANNSATEATTVITRADLSITKSDSPDPVGVSQALSYTLNGSNAGPSDAQSLTVTDTLPAGVSYVSASGTGWSCSQVAGVVTCTKASMNAGGSSSITVNVTAPSSTGSITNNAAVASTTTDPDATNNSASAGTTVVPAADLSITKTDSPDPVSAGNNVVYTIAATNGGPSSAASVQVTDAVPAGTSFVSADGGGSESGGTVTWNLGTIANGGSSTVHMTVKVNSGRTSNISNTASVTTTTLDPVSGNNSATQPTTVQTRADLSITKTDSPDPVQVGQPLTYTLTVSNAGPSDAASVVATDTLPGSVAYGSATPSQGSCSQAAGVVTCNLGTIAAGGSATVTIGVTPGSTGSISNTASVSSGVTDPDGTNNSATEGTTVTPSADLSITKSDSPDPVFAGNNVTYTITVSNAGPSSATGATVSDTIPAGTSYVSATPSQGTCSQAGGVVTCSLGSIANGASATVTLVVKVDPNRLTGISNTASVSATTPDPASGNNSATQATGVSTSADLSVSKTDGVATVTAGTSTTYTITVTNNGPSTVPAGAVISDSIPAGTSGSESEADCAIAGGVFSCTTSASLAPGGSVSYQLTLLVSAGYAPAAVANTASITSSPVSDPVAGNNTATDTDVVTRSADLSVTKTDGVATVTAGGSTTYTITLSNNGPSTVPAGAVVSDAIPAGTSGSESEADCAIAAGTFGCTTSSALAPGASVSWQLSLSVPAGYAGATVANTASITSSPITDPTPGNDGATDTDTVARSGDLSISKSDGVATVTAGTSTTYTITVSNAGPSTVPVGVVVSDPIPAGTSGSESEADCAISAGTFACTTTLAIAPGGSISYQLTLSLPAGYAGASVVNTASITSSPISDPSAGNNSATDTDTVATSADLSIVKSDSPDPVGAGQTLTYTLAVSNAGPSNASGVSVTDTLPGSVTYGTATPSQGSCSQVAGTVTCPLGAIAAGGSASVTITVTPTALGTIGNSASVSATTSDPDHSNNTDTEDTEVTPLSDLWITKSDSTDPVTAGTDLTYTIVAHNDGPSAATGVSVSDPVPAGTSFVSADAGGSESAGTVTWTIGGLAAGGSTTVHVTVHVNPGRTTDLSNTATVSGNEADPDATNNSATEPTAVATSTDLWITKSDSTDPVTAGTDLTYTIVAHNDGPSAATGVSVSDPVPAGTSFVSADNGGSESAGTVTWTLGGLAAGGSTTVHVTVHVNPGRTTDLSNTATVSGNEADPDATNNSATETTAVATSADLSVTKTDGVATVTAGGSTTYTITLTNNGPSTVPAGAVVSDAIPAGTSGSESEADCAIAAGTFGCTTSSALAPGASVSWQLSLSVPAGYAGATVANTASITSSPITDPTPGNDGATDTDTVARSTDLWITKSDSTDPVTAGTDLTYTIVAHNDGPSAATGVSVSDPVPAGTSFVSADNGGSESAGTVTWTLGGLAAGGSTTVHVTVHVNPGRTTDLSNTATVSGNEADPDATNNSATETTAVATSADLSVTKTDGVATVTAGGSTTYTITLTNNGPSTVPAGAVVSDAIPAGTSGSESEADCAIAAGTFGCTTSSALAPGASVSWQLSLSVPAGYAGATVANTASITSSPITDPTPGNDSATDTDTVARSTDLWITKSDSTDPVTAGTDLTYTIVAHNDGPSAATGVSVSDPVPAGTSFVSADAGGSESAGTVTWTLGGLAAGGSTTVHVTVHVNPGRTTDLSNTATVSGNEADPDATNNSATETTAVATSADLSVTKTDGVATVTAGGSTTYTITLTNNGPSTVPAGAVVSDAIPAGTSGSESEADCAIAAGTFGCTTSSALAPGASVSWQLSLSVPAGYAGATVANTASITSSPITDPTPGNDGATDTDTVARSTDLWITKSDSTDPVTAGTNLTYTIVAHNDGPSAATGVSVSDPVPAGTSFVSADAGGSESAGTVTWTLGGLAAGGSTTVHVTVHVNPGRTTDLSNTATVSGNEADPDATNNSATETTAVATSTDLWITKSDSTDPVTAGTDLTYTIVAHNDGPSAATGVSVSDPVPAGTSFVSADAGGSESAGTVTWTIGGLAAGGSTTVHVTVHVNPGRTADLSNTATVSGNEADPDATNNSATEPTAVATSTDLWITKSDSTDPVTAGTNLTYTIVAHNDGPSAATGVSVSDPVPAGTSFVSADAGGSESAGTVTWTLGGLAAGGSTTVHVTVHVNPGRTADLSNTATVSGNEADPDATNNSATETTAVATSADLSVTKTDGVATVTAGGSTTYTITLTNNGPSTVPAGAVVSDAIPAGTSGSESEADCAIAAGTFGCTTSSALAPGASVSWQLGLSVPAGYAGATVANTASITSSPITDPTPGNDGATDTDTVARSTDLWITKSDSTDPVTAGTNLTYTIVAHNDGPSAATGVSVSDPVPAGTSFVSADAGGSESAGTVTWTLGGLAAGGSTTVHVTVHVNPGRTTDLSNTATVSGNEADPDATNNSATETTAVATSTDLWITKSDSTDPVTAGTDLTYTIVAHNDGPSAATGVSVSDPVPAGTSFVSADAGGSESAGTVTWTIGGLAAGGSTTVHVTVHVNPGRTTDLSNTATVSGNEADPDATNNSATEPTAVATSTDLWITKSDSTDPVTAGTDLTYTIVAHNDGPSAATGVSVSDPVPAGTSFVSADAGGSESAGTVTWTIGGLAAGGSTTVHVTVHVNPGRTTDLSNTATVSGNEADPDATNNSATEPTAVATSTDLWITKSDSTDPVTAGTNLTYTIVAHNDGPSAATGVSVSDPVPAGTSFVSADNGGSESAGTVTWTLGGLAAGGSTTVHVTVHVNPGRTADLSNTATVSGNEADPDATNNSATETTAVATSADLSVTKTDGVATVTAGGSTTYTITLTNNGPSTVPAGAVVSDAIPAGTSGSESEADCAIAAGTFGCTTSSALAPGASVSWQLGLSVPAGYAGATVANTASITSSPITDPTPGNDGATDTDTVARSTDLWITKSDSTDPVTAGTDLTYTIVAHNDGPSAATGVSVSDPVPAGTSFVSADNGGSESAGTVTWTLGGLAAGGSTTVHVTVHVNPGRTTDLSNTATVSGNEADPDATNNSATETTAVATSTDLWITKTDGVATVTAGGSTTYTITLTNNGPSTVPAGAVVSDAIPAGTSGSESEADCAIAAGTFGCTTSSALAPGASVSWQLGLSVPAGYAGATVANTASITSSPITDPTPGNDGATDTDTVARSTDLWITKSDSTDPVTAGTNLTYTIVAHNDGPSAATGVSVSDPVPAGTSFVSADNGGSESAGTVTWTLGGLAAGGSTTVHVTVHVNPGRTTDLSNTATVSGNEADPDATNNSATETTAVATSTDLWITKSDSTDPVTAGTDLTYTIVAHNDGPSAATGVSVSDPVPAGTSFVSADNGGSESAGTVTWTLGGLAAGGSTTVHVTVHVNPGRTTDLSNTATVSGNEADPDATNNSATETTAVATSADLSIVKSDSPDPVQAGHSLTYTLSVANAGPSTASAAVVTDDLPASVVFVSATPSQGSCVEAAGTVTCPLGALASGGSATVTVVVTPTLVTTITNDASVTSSTSDPDPSNNADSEDTVVSATPVVADVSASVTDGVDPAVPGSDLTYTIAVSNGGPDAASSVSLSDPIPAGTTFVSADAGGSEAGGVVTWSLGSLPDGGSETVHITVHVNPARTADLSNIATASTSTTDSNPSNDADTEPTALVPTADLSISKSDSADPIAADSDLTYTLVVGNAGPSDDTLVFVSDPMPAGTSFVSADNGGVEAGGIVTWNVGTLASGDSVTLHVTVHVDPARTAALSNTAGAVGDVLDLDLGNNYDTEATAVTPLQASADLSITKSDSADPVTAGSDLTYTIVATNGGPDDAANVTVTDPIPAAITFVSADGGGTEAGGTVTWNIGSLSNGASVTLHVTVHVDAGRTANLSNTATVGSSTSDPDPSNNDATEATAVSASADLAVTKSASADPAPVDADLTYTISVSNAGPSDATGVVVTDPIPAGSTFVSADGGGAEAAGTVTWNVGSLADGATATLHVTVHVNASTTSDLVNTATASATTSDPDPSNNAGTATTPVELIADLSIVKTAAPDPVQSGHTLTYTLDVANAGPSAASGVVATDPLPGSVVFGSAGASQGTCAEAAGTVTCDLGSLASGASATITIVVTPLVVGSLSNTASVHGDPTDPDPSNDSSTASVTVSAPVADLSITKTGTPDPAMPGDQITYTLVVSNAGPDDAVDSVVIDPLPAGVTFVSADGGGSESGGTVAWNVGTISNGDSITRTLVVSVDTDTEGSIQNTAHVTSATADPAGANDASTATVVLDPPPAGSADLSIRKTVADPHVAVKGEVGYTITVTNNGPDDATGVVATDDLPSGLRFVSSTADHGSYEAGSGEWTIGGLANGETATLHLVVRVIEGTEGTDIRNVASVVADQSDPDSTNDVGSADIDVAKALPLVEHRHDDVEGETAFTGLAAARIAWWMLTLLLIGLAAIAEGRRRDRRRA